MSAASQRHSLATIGFVTVTLSGICLWDVLGWSVRCGDLLRCCGKAIFTSTSLWHSDRQFHKKERTLKVLKRKALDKNPDEFYFKMVRTCLKVSLVDVD